MKYKAIIFDMDGTIINTSGIWETATIKLIEAKGKQLTTEKRDAIFNRTHGLQIRPSCTIIKEELSLEDEIEHLTTELARLGDAYYEKGVTFIEGFEEFHSRLQQHNLRSGLATNAVDSTVAITQKALNLERFFGQHIYNISHVNNIGKPNPAIYFHTAKQLGLTPADCVVIEDSAHGIRAAKSAGMFCIGINSSKNPSQLKEADIIIEGYADIDLPRLLEVKNHK
jgi:beta-phosphoglucomutase